MRKERLKGFVTGLLTMALILGLAVPALAATVKQLNASYSGIKITLDGKAITPTDANGSTVEPFAVDGTTYLPVRAVANALGLGVGWDQDTQTVKLTSGGNQGGNPAPVPTTNFDADEIVSKLDVKEYTWDTRYYHYVALVVKNNSGFTLSPSIKMVLYDEAGNMIGAKNNSENAFENGCEMAFIFSNDTAFSKYSYEVSVKEDSYYRPVQSKLSYTVDTTDEKAVVAVTNNGTLNADFVECTALFFKGDKIVGYGTKYCVDSDSTIKPGNTEYAEISCYESFDSVKVYFTGRSKK